MSAGEEALREAVEDAEEAGLLLPEVKPPRASKAPEPAVRGRLTPEEARRLVVIAHCRHAHTAYEDGMYSSKWLRKGECRDGDDYYCDCTAASERARKPKIAALARMDGLLPAARR